MIKLENLTAGYPGNTVLHATDITIPDGALTAVIGPNGSGKSTLLKTIADIIPAEGGRVLLANSCSGTTPEGSSSGILPEGSDPAALTEKTCHGNASSFFSIRELSPQNRARFISYLPQSRNTPEITAFRMVLHGRFPYLSWPRKYRQCDLEAAEDAMKRTDAWELRDRKMPDLSGGERQKIYLAMLLAQNTPNILLDEPTTWLDISHQLSLMRTAKDLAKSGKLVMMVLHDLGLAFKYADHIILVHDHKTGPLMTAGELFESRLIDRAFNITLCRFMTEDGWQYYCR